MTSALARLLIRWASRLLGERVMSESDWMNRKGEHMGVYPVSRDLNKSPDWSVIPSTHPAKFTTRASWDKQPDDDPERGKLYKPLS